MNTPARLGAALAAALLATVLTPLVSSSSAWADGPVADASARATAGKVPTPKDLDEDIRFFVAIDPKATGGVDGVAGKVGRRPSDRLSRSCREAAADVWAE